MTVAYWQRICDEQRKLIVDLEASREYWMTERSEKISLELAAALAECERLKNIAALNGRQCLAWQTCADRLAVDLERHLEADDSEALDLYESLKGALS